MRNNLLNKKVVFKMIGRNDTCLCGSNKKYKKCCIDKKVAISENIEFNTVPTSNMSNSIEKISIMDKIELENFFENVLDEKAKCLNCNETEYVLAESDDNKFKACVCPDCGDSFIMDCDRNFILGVREVEDIEICDDKYDDIDDDIDDIDVEDLNDDIEDLFGFNIEYIHPLLTHMQMSVDTDYGVLPAIGEYKIVDDKLMFYMKTFEGEKQELCVGHINDLDEEYINNIDNLMSKIIIKDQTNASMLSVVSSKYKDEDEAMEELNTVVAIDYLKYKGIKTKEEMLDFIKEAEADLMSRFLIG